MAKPRPAPADRPATVAPMVSVPFRYNSLIRTDGAQFGIRPISAVTIGDQKVPASRMEASRSSPSNVVAVLISSRTISRKRNVSAVWCRVYFRMPP